MEEVHYNFLQGGGEMGELMRQLDWSKTAVGSPDKWPAPLKAIVSTLLQSKFPMFVLWGDDYIQFYNDAFRPSFGSDGKHPKALGQRGEECWLEAWDILLPMLDHVRLGGEAIWKEDQLIPIYRNGNVENTYWTFSYSPLLDEDGKVGGVLATCFETTEKVKSIEGLSASSDELKFALEAAELGTWDLNPVTGKFTANARLKEWFGLRPEEEILLTLAIEVMAVEDRERVANAIAWALNYESGGKYDITYTVTNPNTGRSRIVVAKGRAWFGADKKANRFNGTLQDITEQKQAEAAQKALNDKIADNRKQLLYSFEEAPVAIATIDKQDLTFRMANRFYGELVGRHPKDIIDKPLLEALPELTGQGFDKLLESVIATGVAFSSKEVSVDLARNGKLETRYVDLVYQPQYSAEREISGVLVVATDVTEQVISRKVIEESEAKFKSLIEETPVATCLFVGPEMVVEIANDLMLSYWGKDKKVLGLPIKKAIPELEGQPFFQLLDDVYRTGEAYTEHGAEVKLEVDGRLQTYYFDYTYKPLRNTAGEVYAIMDVSVDVTAQVMARKRLEERERFISHIFYNSPVAKLVFVGEDMVVREVNEAMFDMLGRDKSILNQPLTESVPELLEAGFESKYQAVLHSGTALYEYGQRIAIVKGGKKHWGYYDYIFKPLRDADDHVYGVICTAVDVSKEVTTRQQIEEAEAALRNAVNLAELATWRIDLETQTIHYSERLQHWLGIKDAVLNVNDSPRVHPRDQKRVGDALKEALKPNGHGQFDEIYTISHITNSQERIIHSNGRTVFDEQGEPLYISGTAQDVTLQRELQVALEGQVQERTEELAASNEELETTNEELRRSNDELSQYAYIASHDLQEPLRKIRVFSELLNEQGNLPEPGKSYSQKINRAAGRMSQLIKDLLEFSSQMNDTDMRLPIDLNSVLQSVSNDFELLIEDKKAKLEVSKLPVIHAIGLQMNQLFYNLINNSLKFSADDKQPHIKIWSEQLDRQELAKHFRKPATDRAYYRISVSDNGVGFDQKYAEQIFELFKRLHKKDDYSGSGIGLSLCRKIVTNHGGIIYCESAIGKGTTFHIVVPQ